MKNERNFFLFLKISTGKRSCRSVKKMVKSLVDGKTQVISSKPVLNGQNSSLTKILQKCLTRHG